MFYGTQKLFCPVHPHDNGFLGNRKKDLAVTFKCEECRWYYHFPPHATVPDKSIPWRKVEIKCGCGSCQDREVKRVTE